MRILIWNVKFFTERRIHNTVGATQQQQQIFTAGSQANLNYILSTIQEADPDVFVMLEVLSNSGNVGTLATGEGPNGLVYLIGQMRGTLSNQWCLVPPLRVNPKIILQSKTYTESVGVFWRDDRVRFDGPRVWPNAYPQPWDGFVPQNSVAAAQCQFYKAPPYQNTEITFPNPTNRRPYLTTFTERAGQGRTIQLFSVHTKPGVNARQATDSMLGIQNLAPGNNQATLFAGDFNLNLWELNVLEEDTFTQLKAGGFTGLELYRPGNVLPASIFYSVNQARARVLDGVSYLKKELLDIGFVRYGANAPPPNNVVGGVIVDRVAGTAAGVNWPAFSHNMSQSLANIQAINDINVPIIAPPNGAIRVNGFTQITTATPHNLQMGYWVSLIDIADYSFWSDGPFPVTAVSNANQFVVAQPKRPNGTSGNGSALFGLRNYTFRQVPNFGHLGPPVAETGAGTSDHLPLFIIV